MRRYLLVSILFLLAIVVIVWAAPDAPSNVTIGGTDTPDFPDAPTNMAIDPPVVENFVLADQVGSDPYYVPGNVAWTVDCQKGNGTCTSCQLRQDGTPVGTADTTPTGVQFGDTFVTGLTSGNDTEYIWDVTCTDGTTPIDSSDIVATVDVTPPVISLGVPLAGWISGNAVAWAAGPEAEDVSSGIASVQLIVDDTPYGSPDTDSLYTGTWDSTSESNGATVALEARAIDNIGNSIDSNSVSVDVDNLEPDQVENLQCGDVSSTQINCTCDASSDTHSGISHYIFLMCSGASCDPQTHDIAGTCAYNFTSLTGSTSYSFEARAVDIAGNIGALSSTVTEPTPASVDLTTNLSLHYKFEQNLNDSSGNGLTGTANGTLTYTTPGQVDDYSLVLDASGDRVTRSTNTAIERTGANFTLSMWVKTNLGDTGDGSKHHLLFKDGSFSFFINTDGNLRVDNNVSGSFGVDAGNWGNVWTHVGAVISTTSSSSALYVNGTAISTTGTVSAPTNNANILNIGAAGAGVQQFIGQIDDVRIYKDRALNSTEMAALAGMSPGGGGGGSGTTYYVATSGSGTDCEDAENISTPHNTIAEGINCLSAGDTLLIRGGTYAVTIDSNNFSPFPTGTSWSVPVTIASYPSETAKLLPTGSPSSGAVINLPSSYLRYIIIDGLDIEGENRYASVSLGSSGAHHIRFINNDIHHSGGCGGGTHTPGPAGTNGSNVYVWGSNNEFINNTVRNSWCSYGFYIQTNNNLIEGNIIYSNAGFGIQMYNGTDNTAVHDNVLRKNTFYDNGHDLGYGAIILYHGADNQFYNNIIYENFQGIEIGNNLIDALIYNNTIYNNDNYGIRIWNSSANGTVVRNNIVYNNDNSIFNSGTGTIFSNNLCNSAGTGCAVTGNPSFVDSTGPDYDFHIQSGSPARNAGSSAVSSVVTDDFGGLARPKGGTYDIGAYEFDE